jgi:hypothetical protein
MSDARDPLMTRLTTALDRRTAVKTYVPPALAAIVLTTRATHSISGSVSHPNSGKGNGSENDQNGNDVDPGNSGGHNKGGDGQVAPPGNGNPHNDGGATESGGNSGNNGNGNSGNNGNGNGNGNAGGNNGGGKGPKK